MARADPLLVVGTVAYDTVKTPFGSAERVLGGSACYFASAASLFGPVRLVSIVGGDFDLELLGPLTRRGVDLTGIVRIEDAETFHWSGAYHLDLNTRDTLATDLNVLTQFDPELSAEARSSPMAFLANIDPELQLKVLDQLDGPRFVAADTMNFWIEANPHALAKVLARVDALVINDEEARQLAGKPNLAEAARAVQAMGPDIVVVKKGEHGCLVAREDEWFIAPPVVTADVRDPTGAGDAFAGGFMGVLASSAGIDDDALRRAVVYGTACASLVIEDFGPAGLLSRDLKAVEARVHELRMFARFPPLD